MITRSHPLMGGCLIAALGVHLVGFTGFAEDDSPQITASGTPVAAKMGAAFADLTAGVMLPVETASLTPTAKPETAASMVVRAKIAGVTAVVPTPTSTISPTAEAMSPQPPVTAAPPSRQTTTIAPVNATQRLQALTEAAPSRSLRPIARPPQRHGDASQDAVAGASSNTNKQTAARQSGSNATTQPSAAQNNATAANYAGVVLRQISNVRRRRTPERGVAVVAFTIGGNGRLTNVSILRSSGNRQVDRFAQQVIRQAAPFPPPPTGARTNWQLEIEDQ